MSFDHTTMSEAFSRPGIDPRQWVSYGTVDEDTPDARSVRFTDDEGNPLPTGPMATVTLQPSGITVVCRIASFIAGIGEGAWFPLQQKDEVLVVIPGGSERSGPVIVGRLNQAIDTFPAIVAGQDATKNTFGFWRLRTPFIIESAESFLIRSAKTGSQIGIDPTGQVILNNGDKNNIFIGSDAISISSGDENTFVQLNFSENRITMASGGARFELSASGASLINVPGALNIGSGGTGAKGHGLTAEQLIAYLVNFTLLLAGPQGSSTLFGDLAAPGKLLDPTSFPAGFNTALSLMVTAMATPAPPLPAPTPGGNMALFAPAYLALTAALLNPAPTIDPLGIIPGVGRSSLMY